jgi:cell division protein FtsL
MESRIPVPTDNIYKFYALFGLLLVLFSLGAILYVTKSANDLVYATLPELEGLKQIEQPSTVEKTRLALLERKMEISKSDKAFFMNALAVVLVVALSLMFLGFLKWHRDVQPVMDRTAKVQLEIAKLQLEKLRREIGLGESPGVSVDAVPLSGDASDHPEDESSP